MNNELLKKIREAEEKKVAIGHFNFAELTVLKAGMVAAKELGVPMILGMSESERAFFRFKLIKSVIVSDLLTSKECGNLFFNADHTKSFEKIKEAVEAGYDSVIFDGSQLLLEENISQTREVVEYVKKTNPNIIVEGEIGYIGTSSKLLDAVPEGVQKTTVEEAVRFVKETGVDMLAPAVSNIHGMLANAPEPKLDIELIKAIKEVVKIPLVLHGASGNSDEDIRAAIKAGINIIHINTEIRVAWREALHKFLNENPKEVAPYKILASAEAAAKEVIVKKLKLFNLI